MATKKKSEKLEQANVDPHEPRESEEERLRSTSPIVRVGDTWESTLPKDDDRSGGKRRVGVLALDDGEVNQVLVEDKVTGRKSHIFIDRFEPSNGWRFIG